jgi:hypothetical protein
MADLPGTIELDDLTAPLSALLCYQRYPSHAQLHKDTEP